jgi:putative MATE family efflux protein
MLTRLGKLFTVDAMVPQNRRMGPMPQTGEAYRQLMRIALPSVIEMVLMSLAGSVDTMMVGQLGHEAIAAVGLTGQPRMLLLSVFFAINVGVTAIVARRKGENREDDARRTLRNACVLILALAGILTIPAYFFAPGLMELAGAQSDTLADATRYFQIISLSLPVNGLTMVITAAQRGIGNTRITMMINIVANLVNIVLNYLLIGGHFGFPALGVAGAALATVIGFTVGLVLALLSVLQPAAYLHLSFKESWKLDVPTVRAIASLGGNAALEQVALRVGFFTFARIVASMGTVAFATHQICMQFLNLSFTFGDGLAVAGTALVGQNLGRGRPDCSLLYGKTAQRLALIISCILFVFFISLRAPLISLFSQDPAIIALGSQVMIMVAVFQPFQTSSVVISGCLRGAGDTRFVARVMLVCVTGIRPILAYLLVKVFHVALPWVWMASLIDMMVRLTFVYIRFNSCKWFTIKV